MGWGRACGRLLVDRIDADAKVHQARIRLLAVEVKAPLFIHCSEGQVGKGRSWEDPHVVAEDVDLEENPPVVFEGLEEAGGGEVLQSVLL